MTNYVPTGPALRTHGDVSIAQVEQWEAAQQREQREDMLETGLYVAAAISVAVLLYYVRPIYHSARKSAGRFRAWLNAYGA